MITNLKFLQQNTEAKQHHQQTSTNSLHQTWAMNLWYLPSTLSSIGHSYIKRIDINRPDCRHGKTGQNFLTQPDPTRKIPNSNPISLTWSKNGLTRDPTRPNPKLNHFLKTFLLGKKIVKLRQYWFNCLLWGLRK